MPYDVRKVGSKWVVMKADGSGKVFGRHDSAAKARRQLAAIMANTHGE